jgi:hypothetical protein
VDVARAARGGIGGGSSIPTHRPTRFRLIPAAFAAAIAFAIVALSLDARSGGLLFLTGTVGVLALGVLGGALVVGNPAFLGPAVAVLELAYLQRVLLAGAPSVVEVGLVSLAVLLVGELGQWSLDNRLVRIDAPRMHLGRLWAILGLVAVSAVAVTVVSVGAVAPVAAGIAVSIIAVAATVATIAVVSAAATRAARP